MSEAIDLLPAISGKNRYHREVARVTTSSPEKVTTVRVRYRTTSSAETTEEVVNRLLARWHTEVAAVSSLSEIVEHPCYQAIVALGWSAVPRLIRELRREPDFLFDALTAITGEDPLRGREDLQGDVAGMAEVWIDWGRQRGIR